MEAREIKPDRLYIGCVPKSMTSDQIKMEIKKVCVCVCVVCVVKPVSYITVCAEMCGLID